MAKPNYSEIKAAVADLQDYATKSANRVAIFPTQGLGAHCLNTIAIKTAHILNLFKGETNDDKPTRERFFSKQLELFNPESIGQEQIADDAKNPGVA
jgi:hypothetical protein